jgi:hypothetical protein
MFSRSTYNPDIFVDCHASGVGSTVGSAVGSTVGSVVGCFAVSEIMVTNVQRYIFKNHFFLPILNSRITILVAVGVGHASAVGFLVGSAVGSRIYSRLLCWFRGYGDSNAQIHIQKPFLFFNIELKE